MKKIKGYNRNISGGKRPHKKITRFGGLPLHQRVEAEIVAKEKYQRRVGQI